jgi:uncharacterized protein (TIGR03435 family)
MLASLPKWALEDRYKVQAKTENLNATKDQMRLMVQALLADRFKLRFHIEAREMPVLAMVLAKPGRTGPKLHPHAEGAPCDTAIARPAHEERPAVFPYQCETYSMIYMPDRKAFFGARNTPLELMGPMLNTSGNFGRPIVDHTGLTGRYDFTIEWMPEYGSAASPDPEAQGPTFLQAMIDQLGLKLEPAKAVLKVMVVDEVEKPSEN